MSIRKSVCFSRFAIPSPVRTAQDRGALHNVTLSIQTVDRGTRILEDSGCALETLRLGQLMRESGIVEAPPTEGRAIGTLPWFGALPEIDRRLRELEQRRADAQARLDAALADGMIPSGQV